jgi:putative tricarboxylic transport membrane protein
MGATSDIGPLQDILYLVRQDLSERPPWPQLLPIIRHSSLCGTVSKERGRFGAREMSTRKEITSTLVLLLLGAGYLAYSTEYPMYTWNNPGPRVFPLIVGSVLILLTLGHLIRSLRFRKREEGEAESQPRKKLRNASRPSILVVYFVLYLLLIQWAGFFVSTLAFVVVSSRLLGAENWPRPVALGIGVDLFCYWVFEVWLKLSLPEGFLW